MRAQSLVGSRGCSSATAAMCTERLACSGAAAQPGRSLAACHGRQMECACLLVLSGAQVRVALMSWPITTEAASRAASTVWAPAHRVSTGPLQNGCPHHLHCWQLQSLFVTPGMPAGELSPTAWSPANTGPQQNGYSPLHPGTRHILASSGELPPLVPPSLHAAAQGQDSQDSPLSPLFAAAALSAPVPAGVAAGAAARLPDGSVQQLSQRWRGCPAEGWPAQALQVCIHEIKKLLPHRFAALSMGASRDPALCASAQCACMLSRAPDHCC